MFEKTRRPERSDAVETAPEPASPIPGELMKKSLRGDDYASGVARLSPSAEMGVAQQGLSGPSKGLPDGDAIGQSLGADLSPVQAHFGPQASAACESLGAQAYTVGNHVAFADSSPSVHLQAHEAAHTIQQSGGGGALQLKGEQGSSSDSAEAEADKAGDKAEKDKKDKKDKERLAKAKADWEKAFGAWIGGKLFELVHEHVNYEALLGYAKDGTTAMVGASSSLASPTGKGELGGLMDEKAEADAVNKFATALAEAFKPIVDKWLEGEGGKKVLGAIGGWVEGHPRAVAAIVGTAAIGAAVGAYLANMEIPEFEKTFDLGKSGWSVGIGGKFGTLQNLAVHAASLSIGYKTKGFSFSVKGDHKEGKDGEDATQTITLGVEGSRELGRLGTLNGKGELVVNNSGEGTLKLDSGLERDAFKLGVGVSGDTESEGGPITELRGNLVFGEKGSQRTFSGKYNPTDGSFSLGLGGDFGGVSYKETYGQDGEGVPSLARSLSYKGEDSTLKLGHQQGPEGDSGEFKYTREDLGLSGLDLSAGMKAGSGDPSLDLGLSYSRARLKAALDLEMKNQVTTLGGSVSGSTSSGFEGSASAHYDLSASRLADLSVKLGFKDPEEFRGFMLDYKTQWESDHAEFRHEFGAMFEHAVGKVSGRMQGRLKLLGGDVMSHDTSLMMGYQLSENWTLLGGVGYEQSRTLPGTDFNGGMKYSAGVQFKDVGIAATVMPDGPGGKPQWGVGVVIPLGRR